MINSYIVSLLLNMKKNLHLQNLSAYTFFFQWTFKIRFIFKLFSMTLLKIKTTVWMKNAFSFCRIVWYNIKKLVNQNSFDFLQNPIWKKLLFQICQVYLFGANKLNNFSVPQFIFSAIFKVLNERNHVKTNQNTSTILF